MNRTSINHSALVLSVAMATAWPLSPAVADKGGTPHKDGFHPNFGLAAPSDGPFPSDRFTKADPTQKDRKSTRLNSSHSQISYAVFCLKKKKKNDNGTKLRTSADQHTVVSTQHGYAHD